METRPRAHTVESAAPTTLALGRPQTGADASVGGGSLYSPAHHPQHLLPRPSIRKTCSTKAALASRAKTNWPMRSFSSGWIDRTASSHSARLGSQAPQEKAQRTPSIAGTKQNRLAGKTIHWKPHRHLGLDGADAKSAPPTSSRRSGGGGGASRYVNCTLLTESPHFHAAYSATSSPGSGSGDPPLRFAATRDRHVGRGFGGERREGQRPRAYRTPLTLGEEITGQRCKPIAIRPVEAETGVETSETAVPGGWFLSCERGVGW